MTIIKLLSFLYRKGSRPRFKNKQLNTLIIKFVHNIGTNYATQIRTFVDKFWLVPVDLNCSRQ